MQPHQYLEQSILGIDEGPEQLYETVKLVKLSICEQNFHHGMVSHVMRESSCRQGQNFIAGEV